MQRTYPWQAGARGRLLMFNLLVVAVTLMVSVVAIVGFRHAGTIQEQAQAQTLADMNGSLALARDTANVATAAVRLSQVVGALEYQSESQRLQQNQQALQQSLSLLASAPLAARPTPAKSDAPSRAYYITKQASTGKWQVRLGNSDRALRVFETQAEALAFTKGIVESRGGTYRVHSVKGNR